MNADLFNMLRNGEDPIRNRLLNRGRAPKKLDKKTFKIEPLEALKLYPLSQQTCEGLMKLIAVGIKHSCFPFALISASCVNPDNQRTIFELLTKTITEGLINDDQALYALAVVERLSVSFNQYFVGSADSKHAGKLEQYFDFIEKFKDQPRHVDLLLKIVLNVLELNLQVN